MALIIALPKMTELIFVTNNPNKLTEIKKAAGSDISILSMADIGCHTEIPETASTLEGNASLKSWFIYKSYQKNCFADDTGLEVEYLNGLPGVLSARYAGPGHDHQKNIKKLLAKLYFAENRNARFRTVISLILDGKEFFFEGIVNGRISSHKQGDKGFGYDPVFIPEGYNKSFAEFDLTEKNKISHRGIAMRKLVEFIKQI